MKRLALLLALGLASAGCETVSQVAGSIQATGTAGQAVQATRVAAEAAPKMQAAFAGIDEPQEIEIGRAVTAAVGGRYRLLRDPALTRYVGSVGNAVAAHSERPDLRYYFAVLDTDEINAFATPGGFVFVTRGALRVMRDEATLAGVLGHEIAHVALHHGVDAIKAQRQKDLAVFAVQEGVAQGRAAGFRNAIGSTADFFADNVILKGYSREQEGEADRAGYQYARRTGYDPGGLRDFLGGLVDRGGEREATRATFFSTHPGTQERAADLQRLAAGQPGGGRRNPERFAQAVGSTQAGRSASAGPLVPPSGGGAPPSGGGLNPPMQPAKATAEDFERALATAGRFVSHAIVFEQGEDRLHPESTPELKMIADFLRTHPTVRLRIEGHTDSAGNAAANTQLSHRRAESVKSALVRTYGISPGRLTTDGLGASRPIATNDTAEGRARNRRVEFVRQ